MSQIGCVLRFADRGTRVLVKPGAAEGLSAALSEIESPRAALLVADETVFGHHGELVLRGLRERVPDAEFELVPEGERGKTLEVAEGLYRACADRLLARDGLIVGLGGGATCDLAGFLAGTWKRGTRLALLPSTLLACVDAAVGGKTGVDLPYGKNLVGVYQPAELVVIDPELLRTCAPRDVRAGLAESIKHGLIASEAHLAFHERHVGAVLDLEPDTLSRLIARNVEIKAEVVARDPYELGGERMVLNFGHTLGHAIETALGGTLRHGECVALGMLAACRLSRDLDVLRGALCPRLEDVLARYGLPTRLEAMPPWPQVEELLHQDKKARGGRLRFVLLEGVGAPLVRDDVPLPAVRQAYESLR